MDRKKNVHNFVPQEFSSFEKGIDFQREVFKQANIENNYEVMVKALENIKSETKTKIKGIGNESKILEIERIIYWYKTLPLKYRVRTQEGYAVKYPIDINIRISDRLNRAYEMLIDQLVKLDLI